MTDFPPATDAGDLLAPALQECPLIVILRDAEPTKALEVAEAALEAGIRAVEVTIETPRGRQALTAVSERFGSHAVVGAGTVRLPDEARWAAEAGAAFTVSPGWDAEVVAVSHATGVPHLPGVATASEVLAAMRAGTRWLKAFPGSALGPGWVRAMGGPYPEARFVVTGGVSATNARDYLDAGARGVGVSLRGEPRDALRELADAGLIG